MLRLRSKGVRLVHRDTGRGVRMEFGDFPMIAFWTMAHAQAPYLCLDVLQQGVPHPQQEGEGVAGQGVRAVPQLQHGEVLPLLRQGNAEGGTAMQYTLHKGSLTAAVDTQGGELVSFRDGAGTEYIWGGDPAYWAGRNAAVREPL